MGLYAKLPLPICQWDWGMARRFPVTPDPAHKTTHSGVGSALPRSPGLRMSEKILICPPYRALTIALENPLGATDKAPKAVGKG